VLLRRDFAQDGPTVDDSVAASFTISAGSGLPPWDGYWRPQPDLTLARGIFYVQLTTPSCCWVGGYLRMVGLDTLAVPRDSWSCADGSAENSCFSAASEQLNPGTQHLESHSPYECVELLAAPNPFNATTEFRFTLNIAALVELLIFDIMGRRVTELAHGEFDSGSHLLTFDGTNLATGIYFARFQVGSQFTTQKLLLLR
jgi:hypothetical protein